MTMLGNNVGLMNPASSGYNLQRSLRFRKSAFGHISRTPASAGNRKTWSWSAWVKRGELGTNQHLFCCPNGTAETTYMFLGIALDNIFLQGYSTTLRQTAQVLRDASAFYHIIVAFDTTQATGADRVRVYVNGAQVTTFVTSNDPTLNGDYGINQAYIHRIGKNVAEGWSSFDGLLTEVNFIDGQALTPTSFGAFDSVTGVWAPKKYTGTYGTNGFYLPFTDNTALTTASNVGLGKDFSGNGNYWVTNNISITAGATYDSFTDVPTLTSATTANYCVLNPLNNNNLVPVDGNLSVNTSTGAYPTVNSTITFPSTGKFYFEMTAGASSNDRTVVGIFDTTKPIGGTVYVGSNPTSYGYMGFTGIVYNNSATLATYATWASPDVIGIAVDCTTGNIWFSKNNTWQAGSPSAGTSPTATVSNITNYAPSIGGITTGGNNAIGVLNFGQRPFSYTPPTGFLCLNTFNLPAPAIVQGNKYFDVATYTTNGSAQTITTDGNGRSLELAPDLLWLKGRNLVQNNHLQDTVRGVTNTLISDMTSAEAAYSVITTTGSGSFTTGGETSGRTKVAWLWKKGATPGFDIVTYTGTLTAPGEVRIAHSLGIAPVMIITKARSATSDWIVRHKSLTSWDYVVSLNSTSAQAAPAGTVAAPSSSTFPTGYITGNNINGITHVAYLWAEIPGFSKFGSYTGNGSADGPFVWTGFRPRYVLRKDASAGASGDNWYIIDTSRAPYNASANVLASNQSYDEVAFGATNYSIDILSNGFKIRDSSPYVNGSGNTYIYAAFAENPFKHSLAR